MRLSPQIRPWIQIGLIAAFLVAALRLGWIYLQRQGPVQGPRKPVATRRVNPDYFVYPKPARPADLAAVRALAGKPVWVREGYRWEIDQPPQELLEPMEKLLVLAAARRPVAPGFERVHLVFRREKGGESLSVPVGQYNRKTREYIFWFDEMFLMQDPRELYSHWKPETWEAIARHEAREGMTEAQITFSLGAGRPVEKESSGSNRVMEYRHGVKVTYRDGVATEISRR